MQGLIDIQNKISLGLINSEAAKALIIEMYGIDDGVAAILVQGAPDLKVTQTQKTNLAISNG